MSQVDSSETFSSTFTERVKKLRAAMLTIPKISDQSLKSGEPALYLKDHFSWLHEQIRKNEFTINYIELDKSSKFPRIPRNVNENIAIPVRIKTELNSRSKIPGMYTLSSLVDDNHSTVKFLVKSNSVLYQEAVTRPEFELYWTLLFIDKQDPTDAKLASKKLI